jgi:hypothetical protein
MGENRLTLAAALVGVAVASVAALGGCDDDSGQDSETVTGAASIVLRSNLSMVDVSSVRLTVQSPSTLPVALNVPLALKGAEYSAVVNNLAIGADYIFTADAKKADGTSLFHGTRSKVAISKGTTTDVAIYLSQTNPTGLAVSAPVIDTVGFDANQVGQGGTVHLSGSAHDLDPGQTTTLAFAWTSTCGATIVTNVPTGGSDTTGRTDTAVLTAPNADVDCQVSMTVTDVDGLANTSSFSIRVGLGSIGNGSAGIAAIVNGAPVIVSLTADPAQIIVGPTSGTLAVVATDPEGESLNYLWTSATPGCTVVFATPTAASTRLVVAAVTVSACTFTITVDDGMWPGTSIVRNTVVSSLTLPVANPTIASPPLFGLTFQSDNIVAGGDVVVLAATASDPSGGSLTYNWSVKSGSSGDIAVSTPASLGLDSSFTTAGTWTAPAGAENGASPVVISVTATSSKSGFKAEYDFTFTPANGH